MGKDECSRIELRGFIRRHPKLQFLGLVQSEACYDECFTHPNNPDYRPDLQVKLKKFYFANVRFIF